MLKYYATKIYLKKILFIFYIIFPFALALGQMRIPYEYKNLTTKNGLPSDQVHHILQDSRKYLWFCTAQGVSRFDGRHFENFGLAEGLADNEILYCSEDNQERVWFHAFNGRLSYFDLKTNQIYSYRNLPYLKKASLTTFINYIVEDKAKNIWIQGERVLKLITPNKEVFDFEAQLFSNLETMFLADNNDMYFLMQNNNIYKFNFTTFTFELVHIFSQKRFLRNRFCVFKGVFYFEHETGISLWSPTLGEKILLDYQQIGGKIQINRISVDSSQNLWLGAPTQTINFVFNGTKKKTTFEYIKNSTTVLTDHEGNTWIASLGEGVFILPKNFQHIHHHDKNSAGIGEVFALAKDPENGNIFFSCAQNLLCVLRPNGTLHKIEVLGHSQLAIKKIFIRDKHLWLQVNNNKIFLLPNFFKQKKIPNRIVLKHVLARSNRKIEEGKLTFDIFNRFILPTKNMFFSKNGYTYFLSKGLTDAIFSFENNVCTVHFRSVKGVSFNRIYGMDEDENGTLWYGGLGGLSKYNPKKQEVINFDSLEFESSINDIVCLGNQSVLVSTTGNGVYLVQNGQIRAHWREHSGLGSNVCNRLYKQDERHVWAATAHGAVSLSFDNQDFTKPNIFIYGGRDNQISQMVNDILVDSNQLFLATKDGLYYFPLHERKAYQHTAPILKILEPQIFAENADTTLQLSARCWDYDNQVKFRFQTIAFLNGEEVKYNYELYLNGKLHRRDSAKVHDDLLLPLLSLPSGNYELRISSSRANVETSLPLTLRFNVPRPYMTTPFAILCYILLVGYITYRIIDFLNKTKKIQEAKDFAIKEEKLQYEQAVNNARKQMIELEQENIRAKIDPHFIFNALNGLMSYVYAKNYDSIKTHLPRLARLIRRSLELSKKEWITIEEEVLYLEDYLSLEKMRFEELFDFKIIVEEDSLKKEWVIVPLLLQIFVENSITHGFKYNMNNQQGWLEVIFQKIVLPTEGGGERPFIRCLVRDNGIGLTSSSALKASDHRSMGIQLVKKRIDLINEIHQKKYQVFVNNRNDGILGVEAILLIPI